MLAPEVNKAIIIVINSHYQDEAGLNLIIVNYISVVTAIFCFLRNNNFPALQESS